MKMIFKAKPFLTGLLSVFLVLFFNPAAAPQKVEMQLQQNDNITEGLRAFKTGNLEKALEYFQRAVETDDLTDTEKVVANNGLCATLMYLERYREAISHCEISLELNPNKWETLNNMGISYLGLGDYQKAIFYLERGLEINGSSTVLAENLEIAKQRQQEEQIRLELEKEKHKAGGKNDGPGG